MTEEKKTHRQYDQAKANRLYNILLRATQKLKEVNDRLRIPDIEPDERTQQMTSITLIS